MRTLHIRATTAKTATCALTLALALATCATACASGPSTAPATPTHPVAAATVPTPSPSTPTPLTSRSPSPPAATTTPAAPPPPPTPTASTPATNAPKPPSTTHPATPAPPPAPAFPTLRLTLENLQPSGGTNAVPACIILAYKADDLGKYPITSLQFHLVFTNASHGNVTGPVTHVSLTAGGTGATSFRSCSLGLTTFKFYFSGTVTYWSSALPGRSATLALPTKYSLNPYS